MEAIKNAIGLGAGKTDTTQEGQEPVSGQLGSGTAAQPYDLGNQQGEHIPQHTICNLNTYSFFAEDPSMAGLSAQENSEPALSL